MWHVSWASIFIHNSCILLLALRLVKHASRFGGSCCKIRNSLMFKSISCLFQNKAMLYRFICIKYTVTLGIWKAFMGKKVKPFVLFYWVLLDTSSQRENRKNLGFARYLFSERKKKKNVGFCQMLDHYIIICQYFTLVYLTRHVFFFFWVNRQAHTSKNSAKFQKFNTKNFEFLFRWVYGGANEHQWMFQSSCVSVYSSVTCVFFVAHV